MTQGERLSARRCRNACLLDVATVYGDDQVELRRLLRAARIWLVMPELVVDLLGQTSAGREGENPYS